jgi:ubiquinol-cytochrome c reductase iron-sulfur subunit
MSAARALLARLWRYLVAAVLVVFGRRRSPEAGEEGLVEREPRASRPAELAVAALLGLAALAAIGFVVVYVASVDTQLLGLALGFALLLGAAATVLAAKAVVVKEERIEERPGFAHPDGGDRDAAAELEQTIALAAEGISRRRLIGAAAGAAGVALGAAIIVPLASLGPSVDDRLRANPWGDGVRLVDEHGEAISAALLETGSFLTAFAEGAPTEELTNAVVVVRVPPQDLELPPDRAGWTPRGILAYSKVCTHAACSVNLFRKPLYPPQSPGPALVCPCHYSTFDVLRGAKVVFGPAGRPLPQLPLRIDGGGHLVAAGGLSGNPGPAWYGVRQS